MWDTTAAIEAIGPVWGRVSANRRVSIMALADALKVELAAAARAADVGREKGD